jgi:hypothetical protein
MNGAVVPMVNGFRHSFASIELSVAIDSTTVSFIGVSSIEYTEKVQQVAIFGHDPIRIGRTVGPRALSTVVEMYRYEWAALRDTVGSPLGRRRVVITVLYADTGQPVQADVIEGWISELEASNQNNADPSTVRVTFEPMAIHWGGLNMEEPANDGDFWLSDQDGIEGKDYPDNPWDRVRLGGVYLPGVSTVKGLPTLSFDKKKAGGVDGATITVNGYLPGPIDVECRMWTPSQWKLFQDNVAPRIWRLPNKDSRKIPGDALAMDISHPSLDVWKISSVIVLGVSVVETSEPGVKVVKIKCVQHVPTKAKSQTKTAKASASNAPLAPEHQGSHKNEAGDPPSKTDIRPDGPAVSKKVGAS